MPRSPVTLARKLAAHTSRRRLLGMLGTALLGGVALPLLPVHRIASAAEGLRRESLRMLRRNSHGMRECCGKEDCGRCACHGDKGDLPIYRTQLDNEVRWCFGVKRMGGELHHRGQPRRQVVRRGFAQRDQRCVADSSIRHGPPEYAGRFRLCALSVIAAVTTEMAAQDDSSQ